MAKSSSGESLCDRCLTKGRSVPAGAASSNEMFCEEHLREQVARISSRPVKD